MVQVVVCNGNTGPPLAETQRHTTRARGMQISIDPALAGKSEGSPGPTLPILFFCLRFLGKIRRRASETVVDIFQKNIKIKLFISLLWPSQESGSKRHVVLEKVE